jgi:hypothetical protein
MKQQNLDLRRPPRAQPPQEAGLIRRVLQDASGDVSDFAGGKIDRTFGAARAGITRHERSSAFEREVHGFGASTIQRDFRSERERQREDDGLRGALWEAGQHQRSTSSDAKRSDVEHSS